jgi:hypothetical protein
MLKDMQKAEAAVTRAANYFRDLYLDYVNNCASIQTFADFHEISLENAEKYINIGRKIHHQNTINV